MTDDKPKTENDSVEESKTISLLNQILSYKGLIIGIAAVLTAAASWFKPPDITATKATYEVLSVKVNELSATTNELAKEIEDSHDEVSNLRAYIEGFNNGKLAGLPGVASSAPPVAVVPKAKPRAKVQSLSSDMDGMPMSAASESPTIFWAKPDVEQVAPKQAPPVAAAPAAPLPPFDQVVRSSPAN